MKLWTKTATALAFLGLSTHSTSAAAGNLQQYAQKAHSAALTIHGVPKSDSTARFVKVLSDHPGRATALTLQQKSEIREILANSKAKAKGKGNRNFVCTGVSLPEQRNSMYRAVRLRAQLACEYAKSVDPAIKITVREKLSEERKLNGRVEVVSQQQSRVKNSLLLP